MMAYIYLALIVLLPPAVATWMFGWPVGVAAVLIELWGAKFGHWSMKQSLRNAGYEVQHRPDWRGVKRWRIGVRRDEDTPDRTVDWIAPEVS